MAPIGKLWIPPIHPHRNRLLAMTAITGVEVDISTDFTFGETNKTPEYLAKFPLGRVPAMEVYPSADLPSGFYLTEANAIARYLCSLSDQKEALLGSTPEQQAMVTQWMFFAHEHLQIETILPVARMVLGFDPHHRELEAEKDKALVQYLGYINDSLNKSKTGWLVEIGEGSRPSLADVSVAATLRLGMRFVIEERTREQFPALEKWWTKMTTQEATKEALHAPEGWCEKRTFRDKADV